VFVHRISPFLLTRFRLALPGAYAKESFFRFAKSNQPVFLKVGGNGRVIGPWGEKSVAIIPLERPVQAPPQKNLLNSGYNR
jgi:hypothetical protein